MASSNEFINFGFTSSNSKSSSSIDDDPDKQISFNLQPKAGIFVFDNLALGLDVLGYFQHFKNESYDIKISNTMIIAGPFVRYYKPAGKVLPFVEAAGSLGGHFNITILTGSEDKTTDFVISVTSKAGIAVPFGEWVLFETSLYYNFMKMVEDNADSHSEIYNTFGINVGFMVVL